MEYSFSRRGFYRFLRGMNIPIWGSTEDLLKMSNGFSCRFIRALALGSTVLFLAQMFLAQTIAAQLSNASPPVADPNDTRFQGVQEDWTSPALTGSHLQPMQPVGFVTDYPNYTLELLQVQWRLGDSIDLYVM